jgi:hypothetical protein
MKNLRLFEDFDKKYAVIGEWIEDGEQQWDILSDPLMPVTYDYAVKLKSMMSGKSWTNNNIEHHEYITTWSDYQKLLSEDPDYQKDIMKKYNI